MKAIIDQLDEASQAAVAGVEPGGGGGGGGGSSRGAGAAASAAWGGHADRRPLDRRKVRRPLCPALSADCPARVTGVSKQRPGGFSWIAAGCGARALDGP
ncbi:Hypothetical predicted protein [Marmota monax]|uniref:Uncharacterized protein n=1 Tax=Marmota monax TaxID=9995 RepID=A0A5E4AVS4_MARMO|nr:hypothetical protein GHT09_003329 [Marmota monax]VTJ60896.1 Hypothetical predicted protein [Marmota monax]